MTSYGKNLIMIFHISVKEREKMKQMSFGYREEEKGILKNFLRE